ncbi:MAG: ABC transporter substrate-binding protein [Chloroflexota bacterium]
MVAILVIGGTAALPITHAASVDRSPHTAPMSAGTRTVTLGMGYVPSVQFAPFYVAEQRGYYRQAGITVNFSYGVSPNLLQLVGAGRDEFAIADGTDTIAASANGIPITNVLTLYHHLPVAIFALSKSGIHTIRDLRGKSIGVPGRFGSTYVGLLAALRSAGLGPRDVTIRAINFTQAESVVKGSVDAAVGYSTNEPVLLQRHGYRVNTIETGIATNLVGPGVVAGRSLLARDPGLVRRFVQATLRGLADTIANPAMAFAAARQVHGLSTLRGQDVADQYAVLLRSIKFWHNAATKKHGLGYADTAQWRQSLQTLGAIGQVPRRPNLARLVTNRFSRGAVKR